MTKTAKLRPLRRKSGFIQATTAILAVIFFYVGTANGASLNLDTTVVYFEEPDSLSISEDLPFKNETTAMLLSLGVTGGSVVLLANNIGAYSSGILLLAGPGTGCLYARDMKCVYRGVTLRAVSSLGSTIGLFTAFIGAKHGDKLLHGISYGVMITGAIVYTASMLYDIFFQSRKAVAKYNAQLLENHQDTLRTETEF